MAIGVRGRKYISDFDLKYHIYFGFFVRFVLILYGEHHDARYTLKYTDIDYHVLTDGARHVVEGNSPYDRYTYRYTPFLAFMLIPNVKYHFLFGKFLFSIMDIFATKLINEILLLEGHSKKISGLASLLWLYNPLVIGISTRGSADSIVAVIVLILVYFLKIRLPVLSGLALGVATHFKLYPIIYTLPIYLSFTRRFDCNSTIMRLLPNINKLKFLAGAAIAFFGLSTFAFVLYDEQYIEEAYLYHFTRLDMRHNFSVYFYMLYLCADRHIPALSIATFAPQFILVTAIGYKYGFYKDLSFGMFLQTAAFVTFNKVVTSQYFIWYLLLLPLITPRMNFTGKKALFLFVLWVIAQASWLLPAYMLEFHSVNAFVPIWLESMAFFCCNVGIIIAFVKAYPQTETYVHHTIRKNFKRE